MRTFPLLGRIVLPILSIALAASAARASSLLPLSLEEAQTLPSGTAELVLGASYLDGLRFPPFTRADNSVDTGVGIGHDQKLLAAPQITFRMAAGSWAEFQASYELLNLHESEPGKGTVDTYGSGDARFFTKITILRERDNRPAFGLRFGTKLPDANRHQRLGTDETDFGADTLFSKSLGQISVHANLGILLLGNPGPTGGQDDLFSYDFGFATVPLGKNKPGAPHVRFLGEIVGIAGSHSDNNRSAARLGLQIRGPELSWYGGVSAGLIRESENYGLFSGVIWTFKPGELLGLQSSTGS